MISGNVIVFFWCYCVLLCMYTSGVQHTALLKLPASAVSTVSTATAVSTVSTATAVSAVSTATASTELVSVPPSRRDLIKFDDRYLTSGQHNDLVSTKKSNRRKRAVLHLYNMLTCATGCNPLAYKGYGCYCGFLGTGRTVDGIDRCCHQHDWCYDHANCNQILTYFMPYKWKCNGGSPYCVKSRRDSCSQQICECDLQFAKCVQKYPCPHTKAMCRSPWRYFQNLFMGIGTGSGMHSDKHKHSSHRYESGSRQARYRGGNWGRYRGR